jgi:hypothetical protein
LAGQHPGGARIATIQFTPLTAAQINRERDWAEPGGGELIRRCPRCQRDSLTGHGRRRKQAHDADHDWIAIRRGWCKLCELTVTFLPLFSPPYSHYSLIARGEALRRHRVEGRTCEDSAPAVKDPDRVADASTVRRWCRKAESWLSGVAAALEPSTAAVPDGGGRRLPPAPLAFLRQYCPLRL